MARNSLVVPGPRAIYILYAIVLSFILSTDSPRRLFVASGIRDANYLALTGRKKNILEIKVAKSPLFRNI